LFFILYEKEGGKRQIVNGLYHGQTDRNGLWPEGAGNAGGDKIREVRSRTRDVV
jgi:hypothetical protein